MIGCSRDKPQILWQVPAPRPGRVNHGLRDCRFCQAHRARHQTLPDVSAHRGDRCLCKRGGPIIGRHRSEPGHLCDAGSVPRIGKHDAFELAYMAKLRALLARHGVPLEYAMDRAAIDTGLHLFAEGPTGLDTSQVRVWFQAKGTHASTFSADNFHARGTSPNRYR